MEIKEELQIMAINGDGETYYEETLESVITEPVLRNLLCTMLMTAPLSTVIRGTVAASNLILTRPQNSAIGIYALKDRVENLTPYIYKAPYVNEHLIGLDLERVTFYNVGGSATENLQVMIPKDVRNFYETGINEVSYVSEYQKDTGEGTISSIAVGRSHAALLPSGVPPSITSPVYNTVIRDEMNPIDWRVRSGSFIEHTTEGTIITKPKDAVTAHSFNLVTKEYKRIDNNPFIWTNLGGGTDGGGQFSALIVNNTSFKIARTAMAGTNATVTLTYVEDVFNSTIVATKLFTFKSDGNPVNTNAYPVLLHNLDTGNLEIYLSVYSMNFEDEGYKFAIQRIVVDPLNINAEYEVEDVAHSTYEISAAIGVDLSNYRPSLCKDGNYYLPVTRTINASTGVLTILHLVGTAQLVGVPGFYEGIITRDGGETVEEMYPCGFGAQNTTPVITDCGIQYMVLNLAYTAYLYNSHVFSVANLKTPIYKGLDDVLRIRTKYTFSAKEDTITGEL